MGRRVARHAACARSAGLGRQEAAPRHRHLVTVLRLILLIAFGAIALGAGRSDFTSITEIEPTIVVEARYATAHNFVGRPITGYGKNLCLLSRPAASALQKVQTALKEFGFGLKVYDCYRPARAVQDFIAWAKDLRDLKM